MDSVKTLNRTVGFIGGGQMAEALAVGLINSGTLAAQNVIICDPIGTRLAQLRDKYGIKVSDNVDPSKPMTNREQHLQVASTAQIVVIAVKPQFIKNVLKDLGEDGVLTDSHLVVSVAAGCSTEFMDGQLGAAKGKVKIARIMPNTPALIGKGAGGFYCNEMCTKEDAQEVEILARAVGLSY